MRPITLAHNQHSNRIITLKDVVGKLAMRSRARAGVCAPASDVEIITDVFPIQFHFGGFAELQIFPVSEMAEIFAGFDYVCAYIDTGT